MINYLKLMVSVLLCVFVFDTTDKFFLHVYPVFISYISPWKIMLILDAGTTLFAGLLFGITHYFRKKLHPKRTVLGDFISIILILGYVIIFFLLLSWLGIPSKILDWKVVAFMAVRACVGSIVFCIHEYLQGPEHVQHNYPT